MPGWHGCRLWHQTPGPDAGGRTRQSSHCISVATVRLPHGVFSRPGFSPGDLGVGFGGFLFASCCRLMASDDYLASYLRSLSRVRKMGPKEKGSRSTCSRRRDRLVGVAGSVSPRPQLRSLLGVSSQVPLCEPRAPRVDLPRDPEDPGSLRTRGDRPSVCSAAASRPVQCEPCAVSVFASAAPAVASWTTRGSSGVRFQATALRGKEVCPQHIGWVFSLLLNLFEQLFVNTFCCSLKNIGVPCIEATSSLLTNRTRFSSDL